MENIKVSYGYANESDPKGSFEGIGTGRKEFNIISGNFMGFISYEGDTYLIASDEKGAISPGEIGRIDVRESLIDVYGDGSSVVFVNQEKSNVCMQIEGFLNSDDSKKEIKNGKSVLNVCHDSNPNFMPSSKLYGVLTGDTEILVTAIRRDVFEKKKDAGRNVKDSMISMQEEIMMSRNSELRSSGR